MATIPLEPLLFRLDEGAPVLLGSHCAACGETFFPRRRLCAICGEPVADVDLAREGELYSWTYVHAPFFGRRQVDTEGYGVGQVDLPEGVRVQTVLTGDRAAWEIGCRMRIDGDVIGEHEGDDVVIFRFRPEPSTGA